MPSRNATQKHKHLHVFLDVAVQAARQAGRLQREAFNKPHTISYKGVSNLVTEVDHACEAIIVKTIQSSFPDHDFLLEESDFPRQGSPYLWKIDPLDGTTNYSHRIPHFCSSIALEYNGSPIIGVVLDPIRKEQFTAIRSGGAYLDGKRIRVSKEHRLIRCVAGTGFPYDIKVARDKNLRRFSRMIFHVQSIRRSGSAALDLCYVAAGRLDAYWSTQLEPWDFAAGILIVHEAGGCVTNLYGDTPEGTPSSLAASNGRIHKRFLTALHAGKNVL